MARYTCERCGADENTMNAPHLCKDVKKRLERRQRQRDAVLEILTENRHGLVLAWEELSGEVAEAIVERLAAMGVEGD